MIELGAVGSPIDAASFVLLVVLFRYELSTDMDTLGAGVVALAERDPMVLDDRLASELEVDQRDVDAVLAPDGGTNGGESEC